MVEESSLVHNMTLHGVVSVTGKRNIFTSQILFLMLIFFGGLIGWTLDNAGDAMLE